MQGVDSITLLSLLVHCSSFFCFIFLSFLLGTFFQSITWLNSSRNTDSHTDTHRETASKAYDERRERSESSYKDALISAAWSSVTQVFQIQMNCKTEQMSVSKTAQVKFKCKNAERKRKSDKARVKSQMKREKRKKPRDRKWLTASHTTNDSFWQRVQEFTNYLPNKHFTPLK